MVAVSFISKTTDGIVAKKFISVSRDPFVSPAWILQAFCGRNFTSGAIFFSLLFFKYMPGEWGRFLLIFVSKIYEISVRNFILVSRDPSHIYFLANTGCCCP